MVATRLKIGAAKECLNIGKDDVLTTIHVALNLDSYFATFSIIIVIIISIAILTTLILFIYFQFSDTSPPSTQSKAYIWIFVFCLLIALVCLSIAIAYFYSASSGGKFSKSMDEYNVYLTKRCFVDNEVHKAGSEIVGICKKAIEDTKPVATYFAVMSSIAIVLLIIPFFLVKQEANED